VPDALLLRCRPRPARAGLCLGRRPLEHVGTLLVNLTRLPRGRELVFQDEALLQEVLPQAILGPSGVPSLRTHLVSTPPLLRCLAPMRHPCDVCCLIPCAMRCPLRCTMPLAVACAVPLGVVQSLAAVRNCLFDAQRFLPELLLASRLLWPALLLPLAGCRVSAAAEQPADMLTK